ncbi:MULTISPECIES: hypothetical protein [unclassified Streptomyces]|uniref:hypothetical protein n=1 Tax=unclassified Streptomyces TaxID=2593676 RepID=UPI002E35D7BE|nr:MULTISPECIES: hypothetical protein [unclassified Streptomyces]WUC63250.1 hypothetical protein OG861_02920 [Streptomyces sp. NBC_00539]
MPADTSLSPLIAATTHWLTRAYPAGSGALQRGLAEAQARQAVTVAAWLRYPTDLDAQLVALTGPGGSGRLDWITGADAPCEDEEREDVWRSWVDEVVASWAACLLTAPSLASAAVGALAGTDHADAVPVAFRRLTDPEANDRDAAALLRHPDLLAPIADLHRPGLVDCLGADTALAG